MTHRSKIPDDAPMVYRRGPELGPNQIAYMLRQGWIDHRCVTRDDAGRQAALDRANLAYRIAELNDAPVPSVDVRA